MSGHSETPQSPLKARIHILGLDGEELRAEMARLALPAYRADQVRDWVFQKRADDWSSMSNLSRADRARLAEALAIATGRVATVARAADGACKLLVSWPDDATSEAVLIPSKDGPPPAVAGYGRGPPIPTHRDWGPRAGGRRTACISSQVGCPVGCRFCASGLGGLERNLTPGEMVEQVWQLARLTLPPDERITHVVFMGIGEPLANYQAVVKAVRLINAPDGPNVGARKMTVSTIGLPKQIRRLAREKLQVTLAISLHAANQALRAKLIPWAGKLPLEQVVRAARDYFEQTGREVTLEYVLLGGVNTSPAHADELADLAHTLRCNVNLISYNPVAGLDFKRPPPATVTAFRDRLVRRGVNAHVRASRGLDIDAACGQLRRRHGADSTRPIAKPGVVP